jgi:GNAT superfamily N-acetyltransferase
VAEVGGDVVGFAHVCPSRDPFSGETTGEVTAIYFRKAYWACGTGRRFFSEAMDWLRALGFEYAPLWVLNKQDRIGDLTLREVRYGVRLSKQRWSDPMASLSVKDSPERVIRCAKQIMSGLEDGLGGYDSRACGDQ